MRARDSCRLRSRRDEFTGEHHLSCDFALWRSSIKAGKAAWAQALKRPSEIMATERRG